MFKTFEHFKTRSFHTLWQTLWQSVTPTLLLPSEAFPASHPVYVPPRRINAPYLDDHQDLPPSFAGGWEGCHIAGNVAQKCCWQVRKDLLIFFLSCYGLNKFSVFMRFPILASWNNRGSSQLEPGFSTSYGNDFRAQTGAELYIPQVPRGPGIPDHQHGIKDEPGIFETLPPAAGWRARSDKTAELSLAGLFSVKYKHLRIMLHIHIYIYIHFVSSYTVYCGWYKYYGCFNPS